MNKALKWRALKSDKQSEGLRSQSGGSGKQCITRRICKRGEFLERSGQIQGLTGICKCSRPTELSTYSEHSGASLHAKLTD